MLRDPIDSVGAIRAALVRSADPVVLALALLGAIGSMAITLALHELGVRPVHGQLLTTYTTTFVTSGCTLVVTSVTFAAMTRRVIARERGEALSFGGALAAGLRVLHLVYATQAITSIATSIGLAMCVVPGVYVALALAEASSLVAFERIGPLAAITRTRVLVEGRLGSVAAVLVPTWILITIALFAAVGIAGMFVPAVGSAPRYLEVLREMGGLESPAMIVAMTVSRAFGTAVWAAAAAVVYLRLRAHEDPTEAEKIAEVFA